MAEQHIDNDEVAGEASAVESQDRTESGARSAAAELQRERDDLYDRLLRKTAEFDNYRKRIDRERREYADQSVIDLLLDLLLVVDDFELALTMDGGEQAMEGQKAETSAYRKGVELIHAKLLDLLKRRGVRPIAALGQPFDPNLHQAVVQESTADHP